MDGRLGARYTSAQLAESEYAEGIDAASVIAHPVPALIGATVIAAGEADLPDAVETLLRDRLGPFDWRVESNLVGTLRKYCLLHTSVAAPKERASGEAMWLELAGRVVALAGASVDGRDWWEVRGGRPSELLGRSLDGPIEIRLDVATYSNVRYPGVGVPFYA